MSMANDKIIKAALLNKAATMKNSIKAKSQKPLSQMVKILRHLENCIREDYKAEIVGLFGSYARGEQKRGSDVDILARFGEKANLFDFVGLADFLEEKLKVKVDLVSERAIRPELKGQILKEVIKV